MWINYPNNPTSAVAGMDFFERCVDFAKRYDVPVLHDVAYSEVAYDGYVPHSFLEAKGSMDIGIEFHSLSKSYNMTGWRIGMAVGNRDMINALMRVKSNLDSGIPQAIQRAAIKALNAPQGHIEEQNAIYQHRRDRVVQVLRNIGLQVQSPQASLYIWAHVPEGYTSAQFSTLLLEEQNIVVTPGSGYGQQGEGYIRLSLTIPDAQIDKGLDRLRAWRIPSP
jgi:LL-diaminopimelate aminotransferase